MIVEIENIGLLERTEVQINGLTVIAGINDAGKSTLGKVIFSDSWFEKLSKRTGRASRRADFIACG